MPTVLVSDDGGRSGKCGKCGNDGKVKLDASSHGASYGPADENASDVPDGADGGWCRWQ